MTEIEVIDLSKEQVVYFGCNHGDAGHYSWDQRGEQIPWGDVPFPWAKYDQDLCPQTSRVSNQAQMHKKKGWTAMAFWDYTTDSRPGSNSVFFAKGDKTFEEMCILAKEFFPFIWERFRGEVKLYGSA